MRGARKLPWQAPQSPCTDFNATASSVVYRTLAGKLDPARRLAPVRRPTSTFPSALPVLRIDHLFVSAEIVVQDVSAPFLPLTRAASDHLPLVMDFSVMAPEPG